MGKMIARLFVDRPTPLISVGLQRFSSDRPSPFQIDEGMFTLTFAGTTQNYNLVIADEGRQVLWMRNAPPVFVAGGTFTRQ